VEVFNRTIKGHTTNRYHYDTPAQLNNHIMAFLLAYNFQCPLKALKYQSPYDTIIEIYKQKPELFHCNPLQKIMGPNIQVNPIEIASLGFLTLPKIFNAQDDSFLPLSPR